MADDDRKPSLQVLVCGGGIAGAGGGLLAGPGRASGDRRRTLPGPAGDAAPRSTCVGRASRPWSAWGCSTPSASSSSTRPGSPSSTPGAGGGRRSWRTPPAGPADPDLGVRDHARGSGADPARRRRRTTSSYVFGTSVDRFEQDDDRGRRPLLRRLLAVSSTSSSAPTGRGHGSDGRSCPRARTRTDGSGSTWRTGSSRASPPTATSATPTSRPAVGRSCAAATTRSETAGVLRPARELRRGLGGAPAPVETPEGVLGRPVPRRGMADRPVPRRHGDQPGLLLPGGRCRSAPTPGPRGGWCWLGDAAHCASPFSGMGVSGALVGALRPGRADQPASPDDLPTALARYDRRLRPFVDEIQAQVKPAPAGTGPADEPTRVEAYVAVPGLATALHVPELAARFATEDRGGGWSLPESPRSRSVESPQVSSVGPSSQR